MANPEYENRIDYLVRSWTDDVYWGVLEKVILPAVRVYSHASLQGVRDAYDVAAIFPMFSDQMNLYDHYGNSLFSRLSIACTSIRNILLAIHSHMDCHGAIAASRRAHEALWQMFWLCNPRVDADTRLERLISVTKREIREALRFWSGGVNTDIESKLRDYLNNTRIIDNQQVKYQPRLGWTEYHHYFGSRTTDPQQIGFSPAAPDKDEGSLVWSLASNMTHPNVLFDWIIQIQEDPQDRMDRLQLFPTIYAIRMVVNLSTLIMQEAKLPDDQVVQANTTIKRCLAHTESLLELQRG